MMVSTLTQLNPNSHFSEGEVVNFKSPAEFFAENQNIAGFDNVRGTYKERRKGKGFGRDSSFCLLPFFFGNRDQTNTEKDGRGLTLLYTQSVLPPLAREIVIHNYPRACGEFPRCAFNCPPCPCQAVQYLSRVSTSRCVRLTYSFPSCLRKKIMI
jgi:hypothetical protein